MRVVILGSGTSAGVPTLGCTCTVCSSPDHHNKRMRASAYIEVDGRRLLIDCGPDFRTQALAFGVTDLDAVILTHTHADHVNGLDDLRAYNMIHKHAVEVHASPESLEDIRARFAYCFRTAEPETYLPQLQLCETAPRFEAAGVPVTTLPVMHGRLPISGYRIGDFGYLTDVSAVPDSTVGALQGVRILITSALRRRPHPSHMTLDDSVALARRIGAEKTFFIHMSHDLEHEETNRTLPEGIRLAHDGLEFTL